MDVPAEILVDTSDALEACSQSIAQSPVIGIDTEFVGEHSYHPELCLIQVATEKALYLVDPFAFPDLKPLWDLICDPERTVVVHAGREEIRLCHLGCGRSPEKLVDLQIAAGLVGYAYPLGHGPLILNVLGRRIKKGETLTEWRTRPLAPAQVRYAFDDVRYLLPVWAKLERRLTELNRHSWAAEEFCRLRDQATPETPSDDSIGERWRKLRGLGSLDRRQLAMIRELYLWRERKAHEWNRPARVIVRDDLLVEIVHRQPQSASDYTVIRGLGHKFVDEIFELYESVKKMPTDSFPIIAEREQDSPQVMLAISLLTASLPDFAVRNHVAPNLVATTNDLRVLTRAFAAGKIASATTALTRGWRAEAMLPHFVAILEGRRSLRIADLSREAPLEYRDV
jgi:ribonuclease D